ncbi:MAG: type IV toxin-antitoxin system AbiEi family antitoxin [Acidobacteriota bacterium]
MERRELDPVLAVIRELPFVSDLRLSLGRDKRSDALAKIKSPSGVTSFTVEIKRSYLDRAAIASLAALARRLERDKRPPPLLLARYIPRVAGEELVRAGLCFADGSGNINLRLGERYHALVLGNRDQGRAERTRRLSPGAVQMLFVALARPELIRAPVRQLAESAGVGKSTAAEVRRQLVQQGLIAASSSGGTPIADEKTIRERFLLGYSQVLRPHLLLGRFRGPYKDSGDFLQALAQSRERRSSLWALTGGAGAFELDHFYRGEETVCFVGQWDAATAKELRLIPDSAGPITMLKPFGSLVVWSRPEGMPLAHPWLIYAELLHNGEPRAIEAAEELRRNHLT